MNIYVCVPITLYLQKQMGYPWWSNGLDCAPKVGSPGLIPDRGIRSHTQLKIVHATAKTQHSLITQNIKNNNK